MRRHRYRYRNDDFLRDVNASETVLSIVGVNAVGTRLAELAVREGFHLRLIDQARVTEEDLHACSLFDEDDLDSYKAEAAKRHLKRINSQVSVKAFDDVLRDASSYLLQGDMYVSCSADMATNQVIYESAREEDTLWCAVTVRNGQFDVSIKPEDVEKPDYHNGEINPSCCAITAAHTLVALVQWMRQGRVEPFSKKLPVSF